MYLFYELSDFSHPCSILLFAKHGTIERGEIFIFEFYLEKNNNSIGRIFFDEDIKIDRNPKNNSKFRFKSRQNRGMMLNAAS